MKSILLANLIVAFGCFVDVRSQYRHQDARDIAPTPFDFIGKNVVESFSHENALLQSAGYVSTYLLVANGVDYNVHKYSSVQRQYDPYTTPAVWLGYTLPVLAGGGLYIIGRIERENEMAAAGCAVLQASLIAQMYVSLLKTMTGRPNPDPDLFPDMKSASKTFRFGLFRGGLHYGWPSGHLAVNTAAATSLMTFFPQNVPLKIVGSLYVAYLVFGVSAHEGATMHWFSDVVAGTLFGLAIGPKVGRSYRRSYDQSASGGRPAITPLISPDAIGINFAWS